MSNLTIDHAKYRLDFTLSFDTRTYVFLNSKDFVENELFLEFQSEFEEILHNKCENWVYQVESTRWTSKEEDDEFLTNNLHIQGRLNLRTKMRSSTFEKQLKEELGTHHLLFYKMWFRPTSQNCRDFSYVMKPQTRLAGPFANKNLYLGLSILPPEKLLVWHERYIKKLENYNFQVNDAFFRHIYNVVDTKGHCQKTALSKHLIHYYENDVSFLDVWSSPVQLQNSIIAEGPKKLYFFDIPCKFLQGGASNTQIAELTSLIERVKDGGPFRGTMYGRANTMIMDNPIVIIFSNTPLDRSGFTTGRLQWDVLTPEDMQQCIEWEFDDRIDDVPVVPLL